MGTHSICIDALISEIILNFVRIFHFYLILFLINAGLICLDTQYLRKSSVGKGYGEGC